MLILKVTHNLYMLSLRSHAGPRKQSVFGMDRGYPVTATLLTCVHCLVTLSVV